MTAPPFECSVCGAAHGRRLLRHGGWTIVRCRSCGLMRTWPPPNPEDLAGLYEKADYYDERVGGTSGEWRARAIELLARMRPGEGPILDFGAGDGGLVSGFTELGIEAVGVEPSATARALAERRHGVTLVADAPVHSSVTFAGVTLIHVLEHLPEPLGTLAELRGLLDAGGKLLVEVPNARSADLLAARSRRTILDLPFHLHHFTPRSLASLIARAGFEIERCMLFNSKPVEALLARRARGQGRTAARPVASRASGRAPRATAAGAGMRRRAVASLRRVAQGPKFQMVAVKRPLER